MGKKKLKRQKRLPVTKPSLVHRLSYFLEKHILWTALGLIVLAGLCSFLVFDSNLSTNGDNARYIVLGMSLAQGKGLSRICSPGAPPATLAPPGYPLLLAPFLALFPDNYLLLKLFTTLLFLLSLPLLLLVIRDRAKSFLLALSVAALSAINLSLVEFGHLVMTEIPFLFFSLLGIFAVQRSLGNKNPRMTRRAKVLFGLSILAFVFSYYIRSIGVVLLVSLIVFLMLRRRYRLALVAGLVILCLILPWALRNQAVADDGKSYLNTFFMKNAYRPALGKITFDDLLARAGTNLKIYGFFVFPQALFPSLSPSAGHSGALGTLLILSIAATVLTLVGFFLQVRRSIAFVELYCFFFLGVCILWPQVWSGMRFLIPVVPFVTYYFLLGLRGLAERLGSWLTPLAGKSFVWLVVALMVLSSCSSLAQASERVRQYPAEWQNYFLVAEWCRDNTPKESVFVARKPWLFYLKANRFVLNYPFTTDTEEMIDYLTRNNVDYVILDGFTWTGTTSRYLLPAVMKHRDKFRAVYGLDNPKTWVLKTTGVPQKEEGVYGER